MTRDPAQRVVILPSERTLQIDGETSADRPRGFDVLSMMERSLRGDVIPV